MTEAEEVNTVGEDDRKLFVGGLPQVNKSSFFCQGLILLFCDRKLKIPTSRSIFVNMEKLTTLI